MPRRPSRDQEISLRERTPCQFSAQPSNRDSINGRHCILHASSRRIASYSSRVAGEGAKVSWEEKVRYELTATHGDTISTRTKKKRKKIKEQVMGERLKALYGEQKGETRGLSHNLVVVVVKFGG